MRGFDFSSWQAVLTSIAGLLLVTLIGMGIRLVMMMTLQQRRERQNRQINERLKALVAAYKTLGGSFTGNLAVNPAHMRDLRRARIALPAGAGWEAGAGEGATAAPSEGAFAGDGGQDEPPASERARRIRDAVEAALSDVILFGTEHQVELAAAAMREMAAGKPVHVSALVIALRNHIREVLDLDPIPAGVVIPDQGPACPAGSGGRGGGQRDGGGEGRGRGGGGGSGGMGGGMGAGMGLGVGAGLGHASSAGDNGEDGAHGA